KETLQEIRSEFLYWYPYDFRFSAKDLISNHLTFQLFHHKAIFPEEFQPQGMVVFGMGLLNGAKMSSSKGNVVLLEDAISEFGADTVRMFLVGSAEPWQDFDWRNELVSSVRKQIDRFWNTIQEGIASGRGGEYSPIDAWFLSRLQSRIEKTTAALRMFQTRQALQEAYFGIETDLKWYRRRTAGVRGSGAMMPDLCSVWVRLLAPFIPYTSEKLWQDMGGEGMVVYAAWPDPDVAMINPGIELEEELLSRTVEDIESILKLIQMKPKAINLYVAPAWKWQVFRTLALCSDRSMGIREVMKDESMRGRGKEATAASKQITTFIHRLPPTIVEQLAGQEIDEKNLFEKAREFLEREFSVPIRVMTAEEGDHAKAESALPFKPAIVIE
ncbi:MAG TPA: class I tRNA ligase family protein, partial [Methanomicrobiales archaeon]|nr:class I tRNA ligase family protein [Methanomicrobiales archaeon]